METYAKVLSYAIPGFVFLIIIEALISRRMGLKINRALDTISSLSSGMTNTLKALMGLSVIIVSYDWMVDHLALFAIKSTFWLYLLAFIGLDFVGYWSHRFNHVVNLFWNRHIVHHSSEEFNLSCALRQSISAFVGIYFFLYLPLAIIGIPTEIIATVAPLHLFAQFWYHTQLINKMGPLEHIIVTPSHHRVHHAINPEYIDKNFSEIFIVWDKWFGTFQPELPHVPPVYGTLKPVRTWNPVLINFMHVWLLLKDAWRASSWWDKLRIWFMPTGWRPEDVKGKFPVEVTEDVYNRPKYDTPASTFFKTWAWAQLVINNILMFFVLTHAADLPFQNLLLYAVFLLVSIFAYTTLMDRHSFALPAELVKLGFGVFLLLTTDGWYQMNDYISGATLMFVVYMILSAILTTYFSYFEDKQKNTGTVVPSNQS